MARPLRIEYPGAYYHVMNRGLSRMDIFLDDKGRARSMAMYMCRMLGGHKHGEIGKVLRLEKTSSVSSVCLRMKARVEVEKKIARRARKIKELLQKSQERT